MIYEILLKESEGFREIQKIEGIGIEIDEVGCLKIFGGEVLYGQYCEKKVFAPGTWQ